MPIRVRMFDPWQIYVGVRCGVDKDDGVDVKIMK